MKKILIIYDLKNKNQKEKVRITKKLYGYRDKSNYKYNYDRKGLLNNIQLTKTKKMVIELKSKKDLTKILSIFQELNIKKDIVII